MGIDTHLYRTAVEFADAFPSRIQLAGPRVVKQNRGNGGEGVWKVELVSDPAGKNGLVRVLHARRGSCLTSAADKVVGFGHQLIKKLIPPPPEGPHSPAAQSGPHIMHDADAAPFQPLRARMENEWTP
jgi:hypothetical protein